MTTEKSISELMELIRQESAFMPVLEGELSRASSVSVTRSSGCSSACSLDKTRTTI